MGMFEAKTVTLRDGATVLLRPPVMEDAEPFLAYLDAVRREGTFIGWSPADPLPTLEEERTWVRKRIDAPVECCIVAEAAGQIVGLADVSGRSGGLRRMRHRGELGISLRSAWCDRGLGSIIVGELMAWARAEPRIHVVQLGVFAHNARAIAVYRKHGFVVDGICRRAVRFEDGGYGDDMLMSCWVGPDDVREIGADGYSPG
jgi:RimJ/RimL family protein N-acetyltransferase